MRIVYFVTAAAAAELELGDRPIAKVIKLLTDMRTQLQEEADDDKKIYEKMKCWCDTNGDDKNQAVKIAAKEIDALTSVIEEKSALSNQLRVDIGALEGEIKKNTEALEKATDMRKKALAEFNDEEKDLMQSISALKNAIVVLSKHHDSSAAMVSVQSVLKDALGRHSDILKDLLRPSDKKALTGFMQQPFKSYAPQSSQIFGILKQMEEQFEANLSNAQKNEMADQESYTQLKQAKEEEIRAGQDQLAQKKSDMADANDTVAESKEDLEDTQAALSADQQFLVDLGAKCAATDKEYEERQKSRSEEVAAVGEALQMLNSDDAFDLFGKSLSSKSQRTLAEGFVQVGVTRRGKEQAVKDKVAKLLRATGKKAGSSDVVQLAALVQLDGMAKVKEAIDKMIAELNKQQEDEVGHKAYCVDQINQNERQLALGKQNQGILESKLATLENTLQTLKTEIEAAQQEIAETKKQIKRAGEDRSGANNEFQQTVADQRETQYILKKVADRLDQFYKKKEQEESLIQRQPEPGAAAPPPPEGFKDYKKNEGSNSVSVLLQEIIGESKQLEAEAIQAEQDAQTAYEKFVKDSNTSVGDLQKSITDKEEAVAEGESERSSLATDINEQKKSLNRLDETSLDLHHDCDFILENFDERQASRADEIEGLRQAKAILSGADFS